MKKSTAKERNISEYAYKKYVERYDKDAPVNIEKVRKERAAKRKEWWKTNWIALSSMLLSAIAVIIALLK